MAITGIASNQNFRIPNWTGQLVRVKDKDLNAPPGGPANNDAYLVGPAGSGLWASHSLAYTQWNSGAAAWQFVAAVEGMVVWVDDENLLYTFDGAAWVSNPKGVLAVAYAASLNLDTSAYKDFEIGPLTGNLAITLTNGVDGSEGLINVKQDGGGVRTVSIVAAGRTVIKSTSIASLAAALGAGAQTVYWYRLYTIDGVGYLQLSIDFLA